MAQRGSDSDHCLEDNASSFGMTRSNLKLFMDQVISAVESAEVLCR